MDADLFLKRAAAQRVIRRAARIAQTAVSVHAQDVSGESQRVTGCGTCADACAYVHTLPWGAQACRKSRETPARQALARGKPVPFICHMGFACVAAPVLPGEDTARAMTLGPFCPSEAPDSLEADARVGLARLEHAKHETLPFGLNDIPRVGADTPAEVAQWLSETLLEQYRLGARSADDAVETERVSADAAHARPGRRRRPDGSVRDAFGAKSILAAMAARSSAPLRDAIRARLNPNCGPLRPNALRARALALASAVIEAAERAGSVPPEARDRLARLGGELEHVERPEAACRAVLRTLSPLRRAMLRRASSDKDLFGALEAIVTARLTNGVTLTDAASHVGLTPSTLTRRIEARYGVTFTGYVARKRVERAVALLKRTQLSVDEIARRVGFTDGAHLRKQLQRFEGISPSDVRSRDRAAG